MPDFHGEGLEAAAAPLRAVFGSSRVPGEGSGAKAACAFAWESRGSSARGFPSVFLSRVLGTQQAANWLKARGSRWEDLHGLSVWLGSDPGAGAGLRHLLAPRMAWVMAVTGGTPSTAGRCLSCSKPPWLLGSCQRSIPRRKRKAMQRPCRVRLPG